MVQVKICGLTNLADAQAAAAAGADYLGFIFFPPSKRAIAVEDARPLVAALRASWAKAEQRPLLIGVFVNESPAYVATVLERCGLDLAQLSGDEPPSDIRSPDSPLARRAYRAVRPASPAEARALAQAHVPSPGEVPPSGPDLLLDTYHPQLRGGTGHVADWEVARSLAGRTRLMLAGGLTPGNISDAVAHVQPFAVDVASGVEVKPGRKDHDAVRRFVQLAKGASDPG